MQELAGKAAIVTGASRGIGAATARELASHGVATVLAARSTDAMEDVARHIRQAGGKVEVVACDVRRYADVTRTVETCLTSFGQLDILVNNAGTIEPIAHLAKSDPEQWDACVDINLKGVYHGMRAAIPVMEAAGGGVIVNISSGAATGVLEGWSSYCATKAAVLSLTRCADLEYGDRGIRVTGLSPGTVATDMQRKIKTSGINPVSQLDFATHIPPEWPARAVAWLCTGEAEEFAGRDFSLKSEGALKRIGLED